LYEPKTEAKVPKYAFRILLWREGYDPCRNHRPWWHRRDEYKDYYHFYISTKATNGIKINGVHLPSDNYRDPDSPCKHWMALHDGDVVTVWHTSDQTEKTELIFRCEWGGSAKPRNAGPYGTLPNGLTIPTFVSDTIARRLGEICPRAEQRMYSLPEHDMKMDQANIDYEWRKVHIKEERERSRAFDRKKQAILRAYSRRQNASYAASSSRHNSCLPQWSVNRGISNLHQPSPAEMVRDGRRD